MQPLPLHSWHERLARLRDRLVGSARFRHWAAAFPVTRPVARRRAAALFDLCAGFVYSQVLLACVRLRLFETLAGGPARTDELARAAGLEPDAMSTLLRAAAALELLERRGEGSYRLGPLGAALVDNPGLVAMIEHHALLYRDLADPLAMLRAPRGSTELARFWAYAREPLPAGVEPAQVAGYTALMGASQSLVAGQVLDAYRFDRHRRLLDVGGGDGTFVAAVARRVPGLELVLFDLPAVAERARARLAADGLSGRVEVRAGSFLHDPLPTGADVVSLVRIVHDHDDADVMTLLRAVHACLPPDGVVLVAEPMAGTPGAEAMADAYFGLYLRAMGSGRPRTARELEAMLVAAGFGRVRAVRTSLPLQVSLLAASRK